MRGTVQFEGLGPACVPGVSHMWRLMFFCLAALGLASPSIAADDYYCLESYIPIGQRLRTANIPNTTAATTAGQFARQCAAACTAEAACSAFTSVGPGPTVTVPTACQLLTGTLQAIPAALQIPPGQLWPHVVVNVTSEVSGKIQLHSVQWMCIKGASTWNSLGRATHSAIHTGKADPNAPPADTGGHESWCAFGVDVAGNNQQQLIAGMDRPVNCEAPCQQNPACVLWVWIASQPGSGLAPYNCFLKADPFRGQNGWTGTPKSDIWIPDSQVHCFDNRAEWEHLGVVTSPAILSVASGNGTFLTVFPERVTWAEANAACATLPGGRLALLQNLNSIMLVNKELLATLPAQTAVTSAWVGALGINTRYDASQQPQQLPMQMHINASSFVPRLQPGANSSESSLTWEDGTPVLPSLLRRVQMLPSLWTVHDVVQAQGVAPSEREVCARVLQELPPPAGFVDSSAVLPGIWYFSCNNPASYICESSSLPVDPMNQLRVPSAAGAIADSATTASNAQNNSLAWKLPLALGVPFLVALLVALKLYHTNSRKLLRLPDILRQQRKRALGQPRSGRMSLVVTDIQGFTQLMRDAPDHMTQALLLHNQVVQHSVYDNVGYVLEQEGDSYTLAFHDAEDAVAFTLQVQQALLEQKWPPGIRYHDSWESASSLPAVMQQQQADGGAALSSPDSPSTPLEQQHSITGSQGGGGAASSLQFGTAGSFSEPAHPLGSLQLRQHNQQQQQQQRRQDSAAGCCSGRRSGQRRGRHAAEDGDQDGPERSPGSLRALISFISCRRVSAMSSVAFTSPLDSPTSASAASGWTNNISGIFSGGTGGGATYAGGRASHAGTAGGGGSPSSRQWLGGYLWSSAGSGSGTIVSRRRNQWLQQLLLPAKSQQPRLFSGVRVRMGVATGFVPKGQEVKSSLLYRTAQDVSTAALGGQVLMDEATFKAVKEVLWRLGAVLADGLSYDLLYGPRHSGGAGSSNSGIGGSAGSMSSLRLSKLLLCGGPGSGIAGQPPPGTSQSDQALALDMGAYVTGAPGLLPATSCRLWTSEQGARLVAQYQDYLQQQLQQHMTRTGSGLTEDSDADAAFASIASNDLHLAPAGDVIDIEQPARASSLVARISLGGHLAPRKQQLRAGSNSHKAKPSWLRQLSHGLFGIRQVSSQQHPDFHPAASVPDSDAAADWGSITAAAAAQLPSFSGGLLQAPTLRMYQVIAPSLLGRAALFGPELSLPKEWKCLDPPYFAAPGICCSEIAEDRVALAPAGQHQRQHQAGRAQSLQAQALWRQLSSAEAVSGAGARRMTDPGGSAAAAGGGSSDDDGAAAAAQPRPPLAPAAAPQQQLELASSAKYRGSRDGSSSSSSPEHSGPHTAAAANSPSPFSTKSLSPFFTSDVAALPPGSPAAAAAAGGDAARLQLDHATAVDDVSLAEPTAALLATPAATAARQALQEVAQQQPQQQQGEQDLSLPDTTKQQQQQYGSIVAPASQSQLLAAGQPDGTKSSSTSRQRSRRISEDRHNPRRQHSSQQNRRRSSEDRNTTAAGGGGRLLPALSRGSEVASSQLLSAAAQLRIASLKPSLGLAGPSRLLIPGTKQAAGAGGAGPLQFSPVTIVFTTVEGGSQLLAHPGTARLVHGLLHRLMLQLLRSFPGSYLVRAQGGDLKYMAAFTSSTAAVEWCLTVQEAALYLPYPAQLLALSGFGMQLDETGRLVFRGARLKMGLAEGTPKCILPDFMGRADYHGPFVNQAARFADASAHGGQVVADADTARSIFHHWQVGAPSHSSNGSNSSSSAAGLVSSGSSRVLGSFGPTGAAGSSRGVSYDAGAGAAVPRPARLQQLPPDQQSGAAEVAACDAAGACSERRDVAVEGWWLGSFVFKGSPRPIEMVTFRPHCLAGRSYPADAPSGKGLRVMQRVGLMDQATVPLPAEVSSFWGS